MSDSRLVKMAKKSQSPAAPEVSSLPIKQDQSPLVIDLPDGQKLVVGHLTNGSVIEVATWRGTGRPDSRTSRLMLGMSSATEAAEQAKAEEAAKSEAKKNPLMPVFEFFSQLADKVKSVKLPAKSKNADTADAAGSSTSFMQRVPTPSTKTVDTDVDEWLNKLLAKSEEKVTKSASEPTSKTKSNATTKKSAPKKSVRKAAPKGATRRSR
jgi:hypothetical protein